MKLYLSRRHNGLYQLTRLPPVLTEIHGNAAIRDLYALPGDPIFIGGICPYAAAKLVGRELAVCETAKVELAVVELPSAAKT